MIIDIVTCATLCFGKHIILFFHYNYYKVDTHVTRSSCQSCLYFVGVLSNITQYRLYTAPIVPLHLYNGMKTSLFFPTTPIITFNV